jgi:hypothetical protein
VRGYLDASAPDKLWARGGNGLALFVKDIFFGEIPSEQQLHAYYVQKHGNLRGLNLLFPRRIQNPAAVEWVEDQLAKSDANVRQALGLERLRDNLRRIDDRIAAEKKAVLAKGEHAVHPQPVDYGLTFHDVHPSAYRFNDGLKYKKGRRWFGKHPSASLAAYQRALDLHKLYKAAEQEAEQALLRRKRSYWESLNGYQFERETAEVLKRYEFSPGLTPGSGDGGIDIEVTRNGLRGVVQCKAHINCVGPSVVRDLYGVIYHCGAAFGIVVSRGGFTRGAADFARDKPIYFLDTDDLIAMQEGRDVLGSVFACSDESQQSSSRPFSHILSCSCGQKLRIPRGKGRIRVHCPACGDTTNYDS